MPHNESSLLAGLAFALVLAACSGVDATTDTSSGASTTGAGTCSLHSIGLAFTRAECTKCMQANCCEATIACFSPGDAECKDVFTCVNACPSHGAPLAQESDAGHGVVTLGGGDSDGGHEEDAGPASDPCVDACNAQHPRGAAVDTKYLACYRGQCLDACD
jgi:hypothetical protein